ncbi:WD40/YVTN/BNR-like repeat-containing protein [Duganella sp. S19_KUP01_CR8]|uniref:WD40/YVTN/BNR-like repeat-containing protein n=1 Tax=Duganella sp. S19_KUP01_CR8 TaxID=3025502 RepID=UPI002FCDCA2C
MNPLNCTSRTLRGLLAGAILLSSSLSAASYVDVLELPAVASPLAARALVNGLAVAGKRLVAVGQRGHIVLSDDGGASWRQAGVPLSADLVAVQFPSALHGWAVGHDGVVLHSADGGLHWQRQLDGRAIAALLLRSYDSDTADAGVRAAARRLAAQGADQSLLDVWFDDERNGFVVGAFGLILHTGDGGASWQPWLERVANPNGYHLNAVRGVDGDTLIAGEQGTLLKLNRGAARFDAIATPYQGSYFGLAGGPGTLLAYGLRGHAYRSTDRGLSWHKIDTGLQVGLTAAATLRDGRLALVSQAGQVLLSADGGASFLPLRPASPGPVSAVAVADDGAIVLGGLRGLRRQPLR